MRDFPEKHSKQKQGYLAYLNYCLLYCYIKNRQGPIAKHRELFLILCNNLQGEISEKEYIYIYIYIYTHTHTHTHTCVT